MEILAFTHIAVDHETPHGHTYRSLEWPSVNIPRLPSGRWIGLATTALSLAIIIAAPGAMALVRRGDTGQEVSLLQNELAQAGYAVGVVDGIFGSGTENALISFQTENGLVADGIAGPATFAKLDEVNNSSTTSSAGGGTSGTSTVLSLGSSGDDVMALQTKLKELGFFPNSTAVSGYYGPITVDAVRRFQQANSLGADGMAGPATQSKLFGNDAVSQDSSGGSSTTAVETPSSQMLAFGQRNDAVVALQNRLKALGYLPASQNATGYFGNITLNAVKAFQGKNGLTADGLVGTRTQEAINSTSAIAATTPTSTPSPANDSTASTPESGSTGGGGDLSTITAGSTITIRTSGGRLNVRSAPNTVSSTIKGSLANGESVEATGITTADWVEITGGWVHKDYVEIPQ